MKRLILAIAILTAFASPALAVPALQLDIAGGEYDWISESVLTSAGDFTLYAILTPDAKATLDDYYFLSISVAPRMAEEPTPPDLGTFTLDGSPINVTGDMSWGDAPLTSMLPDEVLAGHDAFPTYFAEIPFRFDDPDVFTGTSYDVQTGGVQANSTSYFKPFSIEDAFLSDGYALHFDLYNAHILEKGGYDLSRFAPFSHDAGTRVPEPGSLLLLGAGLIGIVGLRRKIG